MNFKALAGSVLIGLLLLFGLTLLNIIQGLLQSLIQVGLVVIAVYVIYELWSGWSKGARTR